jgi:hypothetical protein
MEKTLKRRQVKQCLSKTSEPTRLPDEQLDDLKNIEGA